MQQETPLGQRIRIRIAKNKVGTPFGVVDSDLYFGHGFDMQAEVIELAIDKEIITQGGAWYTFGENRFQGKTKVLEFLRADDAEYEKVKELVFNAREVKDGTSSESELGTESKKDSK